MTCGMRELVCLVVLCCPAVYGRRSSADVMLRPQRDLTEYASKRINPGNTDYGALTDQVRRFIVHESIGSMKSWTLFIAVSFLGLAFCVILHQRRERDRRELIVTQFLVQYHNAWVDASKQAEEAVRRYNQLMTAANADADNAREASVDRDCVPDARTKPAAEKREVALAPPASNLDGGGKKTEQIASGQNFRPGARRKHEPEVDLIAQISTLERQLNQSAERERSLQRELSRNARRLPPRPAKAGEAPN